MGRLVSLATVRLAYRAAQEPAPPYLGDLWRWVWVQSWECIAMQRNSEAA